MRKLQSWEVIDHERVPEHDGVIYLMVRDDEYVIAVDGRELMGTDKYGSEMALANFACDRLTKLEDARILIGGLGMGFTLAAALKRAGSLGQVTVAELLPSVVRWNQGPAGHDSQYPQKDPRCSVYIGDVGDLVEQVSQPWSAILLDVDNGPLALTRPSNRWLYTRAGLHAAIQALIPGGILGIWSADADASLTRRLQETGFDVEMIRFSEEGHPTYDDSGAHVLWMAQRP